MPQNKVGKILTGNGYRFRPGIPQEIGIYYRYYQEGFHVVLTVDQRQGYVLTPEQHDAVTQRVMGSFYHPQGFLADFPEGFPVYHVEVLTVLMADSTEQVRALCMQCASVWAYLPYSGRLLVYENQPGEFFGLRQALESAASDEMAEGNRAAFDLKTADIRQMPYVTVGLIFINVLVYLIMEFVGDTQNGDFIAAYGGLYPPLLFLGHQWWRLFTAGFLHFGAEHLVNNMVILFFMGERMERAVGHLRLLVIYLLSLLGGSLLSYGMMLHTEEYAVAAGASGAVFGVIGGFLWVVIVHRGRVEDVTLRRLLFMLALSIYYGFSSTGVDNWGHVGGALAGFVSSAILYHRKQQKY